MKRFALLLLALMLVLALAACGGQSSSSALPAEDGDRSDLFIWADGQDVSDGATAYADIKGRFSEQTVAGKQLFAVSVADFCAYDLSSIQGAFFETNDGFVKYYDSIEGLYLTTFEQDGEDYVPVADKDGNPSYGIIKDEADSEIIGGVCNIYLVTVAPSFNVSIRVNGEELGSIDMAAFMKKTTDGDNKIPTAMYDGSFLYNGGESTYEGRFLGIDLATMVTKLQNDLGYAVPAVEECSDIQFIGCCGKDEADEPKANTNYSDDPTSEKYFGNMEFFCMYDGMTRNDAIKEINIGLSSFLNGTGSKWITYDLSAIDFITAE